MKKTICPKCSSVNEVPPHYIGRSVSCPKCKAEYTAIEDKSGAMTELEQKRFAKANIEANVILLTIGAVIFLGIPALLIGGCKYMVHRSEVAKEKEELRRERIRAEFEAKYPSQNSSASYDSSPRSSSDDVHGAWAYIQIYVERQLKSPGSAKFPFGGSRHVTPLGGDRYRVNSYVDAQNAFGANVRTNFNGVIKKVSGGWQVESFSLGQ